MTKNKPVMYPTLEPAEPVEPKEPKEPSAPPPEPLDIQLFRLQEIRTVRSEIEADLQKYSRCRRRYSSAFSKINFVSGVLSFLNLTETVVGISLLSTGIAIPASIALGALAGASAGVSVLLDVINKRIMKKLEKHDSLSTLAQSKLTSMKLIMSKALEDSQISDQEFVLIQRDYEEFKKLKHEIQLKNRNNNETFNTEEIKKKLLQQGIEMGRKEQMEKMKQKLTEDMK